jgi:hypothetical protein
VFCERLEARLRKVPRYDTRVPDAIRFGKLEYKGTSKKQQVPKSTRHWTERVNNGKVLFLKLNIP